MPTLDGPAAPTTTATPSVLRPVGHTAVRLDPSGWLGQWQRRNRVATLPHVLDRVRSGEAFSNLARVAGDSDKPFQGMVFTDTDIYKTLEAVAWDSAVAPDSDLMARARELVALLARVQESDGYLNSRVQGDASVARWSDPQWGHELYSAGHLFQSAVAARRCGVLPELVDIATRFAQLLVATMGAGGVEFLDGHPEIETALVELYRDTGEDSYLRFAQWQLELRGKGILGGDRFGSAYFLDHVPARQADRATGHAVRQLYLLAGMVDVAVETADDDLLAAAQLIWADLYATKTYVTGAHGSRHRDEAIGDPYELPPDRAYAETCAGIASVQASWRLLLATGDARYAQAIETAMYNVVAASTSAEGTAFFYSNPLQIRSGHDGSQEDVTTERLPWYECACCPPNLVRFVATLHDLLVTTAAAPAAVQVHQLFSGTADLVLHLADGPCGIRVSVATDYPAGGAARLAVEVDRPAEWELSVRIPSWCNRWRLELGGESVPVDAFADGYVRLGRRWAGHTELRLELDLTPRLVSAHSWVDAVRGCVAVARGPLVYALEQADLPDEFPVDSARLRIDTPISELIAADGAPPALAASIVPAGPPRGAGGEWPAGNLYEASARPGASREPAPTRLIPYYHWGNRASGAMRVWLPVDGGESDGP